MQALSEQVAYLKGLAEGLDIKSESKEGKVLVQMIEIMEAMAQELQSVQAAQSELEEYVESVDEDLSYLEETVIGDEDGEDPEDEDERDFVEVECPECGDLVCLDQGLVDEGDSRCPNCDAPLFPDHSDQ